MKTRAFIQARIDATQLLIVALENASLDLANGNIASYTLDTGQDRQVVTRNNMTELMNAIDAAYNRCAMLEVRLNGGSQIISQPGW